MIYLSKATEKSKKTTNYKIAIPNDLIILSSKVINAMWVERPRHQGSWGQYGAHLGPVGPMLAPWYLLSGAIFWIQIDCRIFYIFFFKY